MATVDEIFKRIERLEKQSASILSVRHAGIIPAEIIPVQVHDEIGVLPDKGSFSTFYKELCTYGTVSAAIDGNTIFIKSASSTIRISIRALVELLADKFNQSPKLDSDMVVSSPPPFIDDMDGIIDCKMDWIKAEFGNKIFGVQDRRIEKLCVDYYKTMAYPLLVRLEYLVWKESLVDYIVQVAIEAVRQEKNQEIRTIQDDYKKKSETEKGKYYREMDLQEQEIQRLRSLCERLGGLYDQAKADSDGNKEELELIHTKLKDAEEKASGLEADIFEVKMQLEVTGRKLKKYESVEDWIEDMTSTPETPVYCNPHTNDVIRFPVPLEEFKTRYQLDTADDETRTYSDGKEKFTIPASLAVTLSRVVSIAPMSPLPIHELNLRPNEKKVMDALGASKVPMTVEEIDKATGINKNHLYSKYIPPLIKKGLVKEGENTDGLQIYSRT